MLCYPGWLRVRKNSTVVYNLLGAIQLFFSCSNGVIPHTFDDGSRLGHVTSLVELKNSEGPRGEGSRARAEPAKEAAPIAYVSRRPSHLAPRTPRPRPHCNVSGGSRFPFTTHNPPPLSRMFRL